ncbi:MAG: hypothetical protein WB729_06725 [Candidatus Sulfotelmatobacter sp.]
MNDGAVTGAAIDAMCNKALAALRAAPPRVEPTRVEPTNEAVALELQKKAMPAVRRDAAVIQRAVSENELKRRANEASWARERMKRPYTEDLA